MYGVNVSPHLKNIYAEGELSPDATTEKFSVVRLEGNREVKRTLDFYNLDAIISVGYRVNSRRATNFRIWATGVLKEYMTKGFALDLERAVTGYFDYIEDLIERENAFTMEEFAASVNEFLAFRKYDILPDKGRISKQTAASKAEAEYVQFNKTQKIVSDFDREIKHLTQNTAE